MMKTIREFEWARWAPQLSILLLVMLAAPVLLLRAQQPFDISIPSGAIVYRNSASCWAGWSEVTAARGNYIVGLVASGTLATQVGTALTNQENRPVGQHTHTQNAHGHNFHATGTPVAGHSAPGSVIAANNDQTSGGDDAVTQTTATNQNAGSVAGTNAPYIQLIVCSKN